MISAGSQTITSGASTGTISSRQTGPHERLLDVVEKHARCAYRAPLHQASVAAFEALLPILQEAPRRPLLLDSGCGTGISSARLAAAFPDHWVVGVDRSRARLARYGLRNTRADQPLARDGRCIWLRARLGSFWRLAFGAGLRPARHCLLYPNPYPKTSQLRQRWHAHPVFPVLLGLGGDFELRTNWEIYAREFAMAAFALSGQTATPERLPAVEPLTPFEAKYQASGQPLYRVRVGLKHQGESK